MFLLPLLVFNIRSYFFSYQLKEGGINGKIKLKNNIRIHYQYEV